MVIEKRKTFISYLKVLACLLITNSHCRNIYPMYFLAIGGGFGNAIFFVVSGYCLANIKLSFYQWYVRRLKRIALPTCMICLVAICVNLNVFLSQGIIGSIIFLLNNYWFVFAISIYYIVFYFIFKDGNLAFVKVSLLIYVCLYMCLYVCISIYRNEFWVELGGFAPFKVYYYLGIFIVGGYIRLYVEKICLKKYNKFLLIVLISSVAGWVVTYFIVTVLQVLYWIQIFIHIFVMLFCVSILLLVIIYSEKIKIYSNHIDRCLSLISDSTLEIYYVQVTFIQYCLVLPFPVNMIVFWSTAFIGGILFHYIVEKISKTNLKIRGGSK